MSNIYIQETFVNQTKGYQFGDSPVHETFTDDRGKLFRSLQQEYGRCASKVYRDRPNKPPMCIGWVFEKRMQYEDARDNRPDSFYIREVWVTLHTAEPTRTIEYHYQEVK